ncbi:DNA-invertase [Luteococcus japonicus LSP_Lj1]|uniref:DNA-invertase n=2 Tax=Luteococcus japonicus TaxID=33984 RepID=A0A1R4IQ20_9ACTN|nr:DNA-invertase [Luteococcus japonicus LSP_Lj1]
MMAAKLIGYARVSTRGQGTDRQVVDLLTAGVRRDDLYVDHGASGALARRPELDRAMAALEPGDTLVVCTLDRLGRNTSAMLDLAASLKDRGLHLRVLNLGGEAVNTATPMGELLFTVLVALAQMEREVKLERSRDSVAKRRAAGRDLGGRRQLFTDRQIERARRAIAAGDSPTDVAADLGMSRATLYRRLRTQEAERA